MAFPIGLITIIFIFEIFITKHIYFNPYINITFFHFFSFLCFHIIMCPESRRTYTATVSKILFFSIELKLFSARFGPLGLRNRNKNFVCLSCVCLSSVCLSNKICHRPSVHSFCPICLKFGTLVYLWYT